MAHRKGFTLIELLVVISIIALLIAILLPALKKARDETLRLNGMTNVRTIGAATLAYTVDEDGYLPARPNVTAWPHVMKQPNKFDLETTFIEKYIGGEEVRNKVMFSPGPCISEYRYPSYKNYSKYDSTSYVTYSYFNYTPPAANDAFFIEEKYDLSRNNVEPRFNAIALWGTLTFQNIGTQQYVGFELDTTGVPRGMNGVFGDGSARWVDFDESEAFYSSTHSFWRPITRGTF